MSTIEVLAEPGPIAIDPRRTAVVMIDMQRDFLERGGFGSDGNCGHVFFFSVRP